MRFGVSVENQVQAAEARRQFRVVIREGAEDLAQEQPQSVDVLNDDSDGDNQILFILGLHDPFDAAVARRFKVG